MTSKQRKRESRARNRFNQIQLVTMARHKPTMQRDLREYRALRKARPWLQAPTLLERLIGLSEEKRRDLGMYRK